MAYENVDEDLIPAITCLSCGKKITKDEAIGIDYEKRQSIECINCALDNLEEFESRTGENKGN